VVRTIEAIYENGVLRPLQAIDGLAEHERVTVTVTSGEGVAKGPTRGVLGGHPFRDCIGILPNEDATEMLEIIEREFEQVNPREW